MIVVVPCKGFCNCEVRLILPWITRSDPQITWGEGRVPLFHCRQVVWKLLVLSPSCATLSHPLDYLNLKNDRQVKQKQKQSWKIGFSLCEAFFYARWFNCHCGPMANLKNKLVSNQPAVKGINKPLYINDFYKVNEELKYLLFLKMTQILQPITLS